MAVQPRISVSKVPLLGKEIPYVQFIPRIEDRATFHGANLNNQQDWDRIGKELVADSVPSEHQMSVRQAPTWPAAKQYLESQFAPNKEILKLNYRSDLSALRIRPSESVAGVVARGRNIINDLAALGVNVTDEELLTHVVTAIKAHPVFSQQLGTLMATGSLTLQRIMSAYAVFGEPHIPGICYWSTHNCPYIHTFRQH